MFKNDQIRVVFLELSRKIIFTWLKTNIRLKYYPMYFYNISSDWKMKCNYRIFKFGERVKAWFIIMIVLNF